MGFNPISTTDGSDWDAKMRQVVIPLAIGNVFLGDMVSPNTADPTEITEGRAESVRLATAGDFVTATTTSIMGAVISFTPDFTDEGSLIRNFHQSGSDQLAKLVYGTDVIYESTDVDGSLTIADIQLNRNIDVSVAGNVQNGISGMQIGAAPSSAALGQLRLLGFTYSEGDATASPPIGTAGSKWRCRLNNSDDDHGSAGV